MKTLFCLAALSLAVGTTEAQSQGNESMRDSVAQVRAVQVEGLVENIDADSGVLKVRQGKGCVACLKTEDSIVLNENGEHLSWGRVQPGGLIVAQCLCGSGKTVVESLVLRGIKKDFEPQGDAVGTEREAIVVNQGVDYGVCARVTPWSLIMVGHDGSAGRMYTLERSTRCVDESGMPVSMMKAGSGSLVTVRYVETAGRIMATEVIVGKRRTS
jgi:hypothetical protein